MNRKQEILTVCARLFRKRGYSATSMRDIADAVGIKAASIYNHISSKQEILRILLLDIATRFTKGMSEIKSSDQSAEEKLKQLIDLHVQLTLDHTDAIALIAGEWVHLEEPDKSAYTSLRDHYEDDFKSIIEEGKSQNVFGDVDTELMAFSILSTLRWLYSWYSRNRQYDGEKLKKQIEEILLRGVMV